MLFTNLKRKGITDDMISILIDTLWRDRSNNRTSGFYTAGGYDAEISFNTSTRIFSIKPFDPLVEGFEPRFSFFSWAHEAVLNRIYSTHEIEIPDEEGLFCVYFDREPAPGRSQVLFYKKNPTPQELEIIHTSKVLISCLYWDATNNELLHFGNDKHGSQWNPQIHWYIHAAFGARRKTGLQFSNYIADGDGSLNDHAKFTITSGAIFHDDFELSITGAGPGLPILYAFGGLPRFAANSGYAIYKGSSRLCFNSGLTSITEADDENFVLYHIFATNEINNPSRKIISVMGTHEYISAGDAFKGIDGELNDIFSYMPQQGRCYIGSLLFQTSDAYTNDIKSRLVVIIDREMHPPVSIEPGSRQYLFINAQQQLGINVDELPGGGGDENVQSDWNQTDDQADDYIKNKPAISDEKVKFDSDDTSAGYLSNKIIPGKGIIIEEGTGENENKLVITSSISVDIVTYVVYNETELLEAWDSARADTTKAATIYIAGTITLTANRSFLISAGEAQIKFIGVTGTEGFVIGSRILTVSRLVMENLSFSTSGQVYLYVDQSYLTLINVLFSSDVLYSETLENMKTHVRCVSTIINGTGAIIMQGIRHFTQNVSWNTSGDVQPLVIVNQAGAFLPPNHRLYIELTDVKAVTGYDRFCRLYLYAHYETQFFVTGDLSWYYHPSQNFPGTGNIPASAQLYKKGSVDDLRGDYIQSSTLVSLLGLDSENKIRKQIFTIPAAQIQSDWNQTDDEQPDFIKNKPSMSGSQIQSDWDQADDEQPDFIKNKPNIPAAQIQSDWAQTDDEQPDFIKNKPEISASDTAIKVAIDFVSADALEFVYNCPVALKFTSQESESADAAISPALNTELAQFDKVTITATVVGLIVLNGVTL